MRRGTTGRTYLELVVLGECKNLLDRSVFFEDDGQSLESDGIDHVFDGDVENRLLAGGGDAGGSKSVTGGSVHQTGAAVLTSLQRSLTEDHGCKKGNKVLYEQNQNVIKQLLFHFNSLFIEYRTKYRNHLCLLVGDCVRGVGLQFLVLGILDKDGATTQHRLSGSTET